MDPLALGPVHEYVKQQQHEDDSDSDNSEDSAGSFRFHLHVSLGINNYGLQQHLHNIKM